MMVDKANGTSWSSHQDRAGPNLNELIDFEIMCAKAEGKSPKTVEATVLAIRTLERFLLEKGYSTSVSEHVLAFLEALPLPEAPDA